MCNFTGQVRSLTAASLRVTTALASAQAADLIKGLKMDARRKAEISAMAVEDPSTGSNPVKLTRKAAQTLLENTIAGKL